MDEEAVNFVKSIARLLQNGNLCVSYKFNPREKDKKDIASRHALLEYLVQKIFKFKFEFCYLTNMAHLNEFDRLYTEILDQIHFLSFTHLPAIEDINRILSWLTNGGKQQKIIQFDFDLQNDNQKCMDALFSCIKEV